MSQRETLPPRSGERAGERRQRAATILDRLDAEFPDAHTALDYRNAFELLVATMLSAQCTDERVNTVTPALFAAYPGPADLAGASQEAVEAIIRPTGYFRQKARNLRAAAERLVTDFDGRVPDTIAELTSLPGVARKTANVVISNCHPTQMEGIAVDTHVQRIARRLDLTRSFPPHAVERDLMRVIPAERWKDVTHLLIEHGRTTCRARRPLCGQCTIADLCPSRHRFDDAV